MLWWFHFINTTRVHQTRSWLVYFSSLRPFGPNRDAPRRYVCKVSYCGRQHFVRRRFSEFKLLHDKLQKELLVVPGFPSADVSYKVGLGDYAARGKALCRYACRVHASLGARGMFSPRLLAFLEIDAARVHIEEDGQ